jgi:hypothetical protein
MGISEIFESKLRMIWSDFMRRKMTAICISGALICATLTGCGQEAETEDTTELTTTEVVIEAATAEDATPDEPEKLKTIGEAVENGYEVKLINGTGQDITGLWIYDTISEEYGDNLLVNDDIFMADEERILYCADLSEETTEETDISDTEEIDDETPYDKLIPVGYDLQLILEDESEYVLHSFPFGEIESGEIFIEDEVAYVEYDGYSTKEAELAIKEAEEYTPEINDTAAPSTTQTPAATEAPAVAQPTEAATEAQPVVTEATEAGSGDASVNDVGDQGSENCIGDEGLTY